MKISSRLDYALSCALRVAKEYKNKRPVTARQIAKQEGLEPDYVERLLFTLRNVGVVKSVRGVAGGYILAKHPARIPVLDLVKAFEKEIIELACFRKKGRKNKCIHIKDCKVRCFWLNFKKNIESFLVNHSLEELLNLRCKEKLWKERI